jgi:osmotically inducible lipoprotein OsmB
VKDFIMIKTFLAVSSAAALMALTGCGTSPSNQQIGTGVGAVVGGVAGNAVFGGVLGTVGGAAAGAVIGNEVGKKK